MKNTIINLLTVASVLLAFSCQKSENQQSTMKGEYYASVSGGKEAIELYPGGSKIYDVRVNAYHGLVSDVSLNLNIKVDPTLVESLNEKLGTSYVMCPGSAYEIVKPNVMLARYGTSSTTAKVKVVASGIEPTETYVLPLSIEAASEGGNYTVADTLSAYVLFKQKDFDPEKGAGTKEAPFLIHNVDDFMAMDDMIGGGETFFLLTSDLDMAEVTEWKPINTVGGKIDFNGAGFTISNFSCGAPLFDKVIGKIYDLKVVKANITNATSKEIGIVAADLGSSSDAGSAEHVYVQGKITNNAAYGTGGLFGYAYNATINACSAEIEAVANKYYIGGIVGRDMAKSSISNCWTIGSINNSSSRYAGGIIGDLLSAESGVYNCFTTIGIISRYFFGGIVGCANLGANNNNATNDPKNHIEKCIAWNEYIKTDLPDSDVGAHYSCGVIVGYTALKNYHVDCYRKKDIVFKECMGNADNVPVDHMNSSPDKPLVVGLSGTYVFPYHGIAAAADDTVSSIAKKLGWDETIWDLSGSLPFFKGADGPKENPDVPSDGQLPDFDENIFF